jgi:hypothetical protein
VTSGDVFVPVPQPTVTVSDPDIPGIKIVRPTDAEFKSLPDADHLTANAFAIRNESQHHIVGIAVAYQFKDRGYDAVIDGVSAPLDIPYGGTLIADRGFLKAFNSPYFVFSPDDESADPVLARIAFVVFDNGDYYGSDAYLQDLQGKVSARRSLLAEMERSVNKEEVIKRAGDCLKSESCSSGMSAAEAMGRAGLLDDFTALHRFGISAEKFVTLHKPVADSFPAIKRKKLISVRPEANGTWHTDHLTSGTCANNSSLYAATLTNTGCIYPALSVETDGTAPSGYLNAASVDGFRASYGAACVFYPYGSYVATDVSYIRDSFNTLHIAPGSDQGQALYTPRENIHTYIQSFGNFADTWDFGVLSGLVEPYLDPPPAGTYTQCSAVWIQAGTPYSRVGIDYLGKSSAGIMAASSFPWQADGSLIGNVRSYPQGTDPYYGYVLDNRKSRKFCEKTQNAQASYYYGTVNLVPAFANATEGTKCDNIKYSAGNNSCNPEQSWCCCMAAYNDWDMCVFKGLTPTDQCTNQTDSTAYVQGQMGMVVPVGGAMLNNVSTQTHMGIARSTYNPYLYSNQETFLLDTMGLNSYVPGQTAYLTFNPPGGIQSGDVPVSGDWNGDGHTKLGFYRNGVWYLDANGNNLWDGPGGGDYQYNFGGLAGDVPVVGDWQGGGRSCIGLYRQGLWVIDGDCDGSFTVVAPGHDSQFGFGGVTGDVPVVGKWAGVNNSQVGVVRCYIPVGGNSCSGTPYFWVLDSASPLDSNTVNHVVGQGNGCAIAPAQQQYYAQCRTAAPFPFGGVYGDVFLSGDWFGTGKDQGGVYRSGSWLLDSGDHLYHTIYQFGGLSGDRPLAGKW